MSVLTLLVTSENAAGEKRFDPSISIARLKERLETITGISLVNIKVELYDGKNNLICVLNDEQRALNSYPIQDFFRLHVIDTNPYRVKNEFTDVSRVEKYEMSENDYDKRGDSVRQFLQRNKLGKYSEKPDVELYDFKKEAESIKVGDRCEVEVVEGGMKRRGTVRFCGETKFKHGYWVGVEYDEPLGKNDGQVGDVRYFQARNNCGAFLRPDKVTVGDFPEEDLLDDLDEL